MEVNDLRRWVLKTFTMNGYAIQAEAAAYLAEAFLKLPLTARQKWMDKIISKIQELNLESVAVQKKHVEICIDECTKKHPSSETIFNVISCLEVPCFKFNTERSKFVKDLSHHPTLFPSAAVKSQIHIRRYSLIMQRMQRHPIFRKKVLGDNTAPQQILRTAESLLSAAEAVAPAYMLGLVAQSADRRFILEDPTGSVPLDCSQAKFNAGLYTENCFVLAEGIYDDKVFYAKTIAHPPPETSIQTRPYFGGLNCFGGPSETTLTQSQSLLKIQRSNPDEIILFLAEVWLDDIKVIGKLKTLLSGMSEIPPAAIVLMGNFLTLQPGPEYAKRLHVAFKALGELIANYPTICNKTNFVLIPGPSDPGSPLIFPRSPLPSYMTEDLKKKVPKLWLATNPCRIQYCTREIVVIREDLLTKLCRNIILNIPKTTDDIHEQFAKTLACQSTLVPLPLHVRPVYWSFTHALDLYPLPDLVVIGDQYQPFVDAAFRGCQFINPGYFSCSKYSFQAYNPHENSVDQNNIPEDEN